MEVREQFARTVGWLENEGIMCNISIYFSNCYLAMNVIFSVYDQEKLTFQYLENRCNAKTISLLYELSNIQVSDHNSDFFIEEGMSFYGFSRFGRGEKDCETLTD